MEQKSEHEFHAVANLFPLLEGAAFEELAADIRKNGLREPILVDARGNILDGRNRYRACLKSGVEPRFEEWKGSGSLTDLALSLNLHRRHLDESQRAMVGARLANHLKTSALARKGKRSNLGANLHPGDAGKSAHKAAGQLNVSTRLVNTAVKVLRDGGPELIAAVESGAIPVSAASILAQLPAEEQAIAVKAGSKAVNARTRELRARKQEAAPSRRFGMAAASDSIVLMWVDACDKDHAIAAMKSRGFEPVTVL